MMMQEILKPLLENDVLTDEVKSSIETALTEAFTAKEEAVRAEVEEVAKENFEAAKAKFEETYKTLEESYKTKLDEATETTEAVKAEIEDLESKIEDLETKPFVNVSESDMEAAEAKLVEELEAKYEKAFDLGKEKFNNTFELVAEANAEVVAELEAHIENQDVVVDELTAKVEELTEALESKDEELAESIETNSTVEDQIAAAVAEAEEKIEAIKENLVTSTEIFLEQELAEVKADKAEIMKETQGRELLESIKGLVKQYWDIDSEVAEEILEMKKEAESKVEQYKDMLKKEHNRLEESQAEIESLKKKVIVESRGSVLADDKKEALEKLAENMDSDKLETNIDNLMESVVSAFNSGFSKKEIVDAVEEEVTKTETVEEEVLAESVQTVISSGDSEVKTSDELAEILAFAGVRK
jgi:DNA repair exonuclease SbcCD ATPase subunit